MPKTALPSVVVAALVGLSFLLIEIAITPAYACCHDRGAGAMSRGGARVPPPPPVPTPAPVPTPVIPPPVVRLPPTPIPVAVPRGVDSAIRARTGSSFHDFDFRRLPR